MKRKMLNLKFLEFFELFDYLNKWWKFVWFKFIYCVNLLFVGVGVILLFLLYCYCYKLG